MPTIRMSGLSRAVAAGATVVLLGACADAPLAPSAAGTLPSMARVESGVKTTDALTTSDANALLACPSGVAESATAVIGPRGGAVRVAGSELVVGPGAVPRPTTFTLTVPASPVMEIDIRAGGVEHYEFKRPVLVTIGYARCPESALPATSLSAWYIDRTTHNRLDIMASIDDRPNRRLTFLTTHLSGYAAAYRRNNE